MIDIDAMTDDEVLSMRADISSPLGRAAARFYHHCAAIEQAGEQRQPPSIMQLRRMELKATIDIVNAYQEGK